MDPWLSVSSPSRSHSSHTPPTSFEDNFEPNSRLPDSAEYLAALEKKLAKLKEKQSKKDLVESLGEARKSYMLRLVSEGTPLATPEGEFLLDTPAGQLHTILRHIAPERQAVTLGELVELLKADQLSEKLAEEES